MNFSLEISPTTDLDTVPPVNDIYITMLPGGDYRETAQQAVELVKKGFMNGKGTFTWSDGTQKTGIWKNGKLQE